MKQCSKCGIPQLYSCFSRNAGKNGSPDGHKSICKTCANAYWTNYQSTHKTQIALKAKARSQIPHYLTYQRQYRKLKESPEQKNQRLQRLRDKRHANPEKTRQDAHTNYLRTKPQYFMRSAARRARKAAAAINDLTQAQWESIKQHYGHRCVYCGRKMKRLTMDHLTPISKGGNHTASNIVPACQSCNSTKGNRPVLKPVQPLLLIPG